MLRYELLLFLLPAHVFDDCVGQSEVGVVFLERHIESVSDYERVGRCLLVQVEAHLDLPSLHDDVLDDAFVAQRAVMRRQCAP